MERLKDDAKETLKTELYKAKTQGGGVVSRLQIAELVVECILDQPHSAGKIMEVGTSEGLTEKSLNQLIRELPSYAE